MGASSRGECDVDDLKVETLLARSCSSDRSSSKETSDRERGRPSPQPRVVLVLALNSSSTVDVRETTGRSKISFGNYRFARKGYERERERKRRRRRRRRRLSLVETQAQHPFSCSFPSFSQLPPHSKSPSPSQLLSPPTLISFSSSQPSTLSFPNPPRIDSFCFYPTVDMRIKQVTFPPKPKR